MEVQGLVQSKDYSLLSCLYLGKFPVQAGYCAGNRS